MLLYFHIVSEQKVEEEVELVKGTHVRVVTAECDKDKTDNQTVWVDYPHLPKVLEKGGKIYIDDGLIGLKVMETGKTHSSNEAVTRHHLTLASLATQGSHFLFSVLLLLYISLLHEHTKDQPHNDRPRLSS